MNLTDFKVKVSGEYDIDNKNLKALRELNKNIRVRIDANNLWDNADHVIEYLTRFDYPFFAIEEPLSVGDYEGCRKISRALDTPIILDESFLREDQFKHIEVDPDRWIVNLRISKMGGILRSLNIAKKA